MFSADTPVYGQSWCTVRAVSRKVGQQRSTRRHVMAITAAIKDQPRHQRAGVVMDDVVVEQKRFVKLNRG